MKIPKPSPSLTRLFWKCHSVCALYTGGFISFVLITGAFAVLAEDIYKWESRHAGRMDSAQLDPSALPSSLEAAGQALSSPGSQPVLFELYLPDHYGDPVRAAFFNAAHPQKPFAFNQPWAFKSVFLDPQDGEVLGVYRDDRSFATYLRTLHVRLFAGVPGRNFVGLFGLALLFLSLTGFLILGRFLGKRALWLMRRTSARATASDLHKVIGFVGLLPLVLFAVTGFWLGMQGRLMQWFSMERPEHFAREAVVSSAEDAALPIDFAAALDKTKHIHPHLIPQAFSWSTNGERTLRIKGRIPGTAYERLSQGVVFDKADLAVLKVIDTPHAPWTEKLFYLQEGLHFGDFAGLPLKVVYFGMGLILGILPLTGYVVSRLRTRRSLRPIWGWGGFALLYAGLSLALLRTQGIIVVMGYGTIALWLFVAGLVLYWLRPAIRKLRSGIGPLRPASAPGFARDR